MHMKNRLGCALVIALSPALAWCARPAVSGYGSVEGVVLDGMGKPLEGATVYDGAVAKSPRTQTDAEGRFRLVDVPAGFVGLSAYKEDDGYPYDMFSFFTMPGEDLPKFNLVAGQVRTGVVIHLGAKAAYLHLYISDERGVPIDANLSFSRPDLGKYGNYHRSSKPNDVLLVPPVPFRLVVSAPGCKPWHYGGANWRAKDGLIHLKPGASLKLSIRLHDAVR